MLMPSQQLETLDQNPVVTVEDKKLKILFYHAGGHTAWLYPAALQLKTYIDLFYSDISDKLDWLVPIQQEVSDQDLITHIRQTNADILCTSHYLWNHKFLTSQLSAIKKHLPSIKIIAGGPSIDVNNNKDFFEQYPFIDYAVYGAGEQAFADIVNHLVLGRPLIAFNTSNCAWKHSKTGRAIVAEYKFVKMIETSPFVHNETLFSAMVSDAKKKNLPVWLPYTLTRGCPYSCTFCDWNSGLGNKVSRRKNTYQQEIDLFQRLGVTNIYLSDANVGQYTEDIEMIDYFAQKNLLENAGFHVGGNFSKLKKENNLKIFNLMAKGKLVNKTLNFSVQDINQTVLKNIDRPDVGWDVHVTMANELREQYPHLIVKAQLIYGLPGQTPTTWRHTLDQVTEQNILPVIFLNEPLPASPAIYDPEYQKQFQYEYIYSNRILNGIYSSKIPKRSNSFDQKDLVQMNLLSAVYLALSAINFALEENHAKKLHIPLVVDDFLGSQHYQTLFDNLYQNWTQQNNFYYTVDFSGRTAQIPDLTLGLTLAKDPAFLRYLSRFFDTADKRSFLRLAVRAEFQKMILEIHSDVD